MYDSYKPISKVFIMLTRVHSHSWHIAILQLEKENCSLGGSKSTLCIHVHTMEVGKAAFHFTWHPLTASCVGSWPGYAILKEIASSS